MPKSAVFTIARHEFPNVFDIAFRENRLLGHTPSATTVRVTLSTIFLRALVMLLAWGVLAFGAVYPWAYTPLLIAAPLIGVCGFRLGGARRSQRRSDSLSRPVAAGLLLMVFAILPQLVPLPASVHGALSPALGGVLENLSLAFALGGATTHPLSVNPRATATALLFLIVLSVLLLGLASALPTVGTRRLTSAIIVLAVLVALVAIIQRGFGGYRIYGFWTPIDGRHPFGPFVNRSHFAGWMVMAISLALGYFGGLVDAAMRGVGSGWREKVLWWSSPSASHLVLLAVAILVMAVAVVLSLSRSGVLSFALAVVMFGVFVWRRQAGKRKRIANLAYLWILMAALVAWSGTDAVARRFAKLEWLTPAGRLGAWSDTMRVARDFWLTGSGLNTFSDVMLVDQRRPGPPLGYAHSDYLQLAAEGGLLVGIPILVTIGLFVREVRRRFREAADDPMTSWIRSGACTGLAAIALQEVVEGSLQMPGNAVLFTTMAAIAIHKSPAPARDSHRGAGLRKQFDAG